MFLLCRDVWRRKRSLSQNRGSNVTNAEATGSPSLTTPDLPSTSGFKSSMKGHLGSRPLRERTKERRVRVKATSSVRHTTRRENIELASQDSESAYHTHEASDSVADRTSSMEQDSNGRSDMEGKSCRLDKKLDISPRVVVPGCENVSKVNSAYHKTRESQESDLPQDSNSEDDKKLRVKSDEVENKRSSQSISSENEEESTSKKSMGVGNESVKTTEVSRSDLEKKIKFEGLSVNEDGPSRLDLDIKTSTEVVKTEVKKSGEVVCEKTETSCVEVSVGSSLPQETKNVVCEGNGLTNGAAPEIQVDGQSPALSPMSDGPATIEDIVEELNFALNDKNCVHFNKESDQLREITPMSSRETSPTHTQSDSLLQNKRKLRESKCGKSDTETESENDHKNSKVLPIRRRKNLTVQESVSGENGNYTLRNRKQPSFPLRESKSNDTTAVSSSEGETEGHSSEYSRGSRRVSFLT